MSLFWTPAREHLLKERIDKGDSASTAAEILGCSRDAALGKARRKGWVFQGKPLFARGEAPPPPDPDSWDEKTFESWADRKKRLGRK